MTLFKFRTFQTDADREGLHAFCAQRKQQVPEAGHMMVAYAGEDLCGYAALDVQDNTAILRDAQYQSGMDHENRTHLQLGLMRLTLEHLLRQGATRLEIEPCLTGNERAEQVVTLTHPMQLMPDNLQQCSGPLTFQVHKAETYAAHRLEMEGGAYFILCHGDVLPQGEGPLAVLEGAVDVFPPSSLSVPFQGRSRLARGDVWPDEGNAIAVGVCHLIQTEQASSDASRKPISMNLYNSYVLTHIVVSLHELGWFEYVGRDKDKVFTVRQTSEDLQLDSLIFSGTITFLEGANMLVRQGNPDQYRIVPDTLDEVLRDIHFLHYMVRGYGEVLQNTPALAKGEKRYYQDLKRYEPGVYHFAPAVKHTVGKAIRNVLATVAFKKIAHLGCGAAMRLIAFCQQDPELHAIGVDRDAATCHRARAAIERAGLSSRIEIVQQDVYDWVADPHPDVDMVFLPGGMMHDFLYRPQGKDLLLKGLRENLPPGAWFFVQDMNITPTSNPNFPLSVCEGFTFVHCLMGVPLYTRDNYVEMFGDAGWELVSTHDAGLPNTWIYLLRNPSGSLTSTGGSV